MVKVIISFMAGTLALFITWLAFSESSPFHGYFLSHTAIPNLWGAVNIFPVIVAALIEGNPHSFSETVAAVGIFFQWSIISYVLCAVLFRRKKRIPAR